ncbi:MAG TPA: hypothetical protein VGB77_22700 [Abditibacteriaceae bacterium]|jgi:hypothetical protein
MQFSQDDISRKLATVPWWGRISLLWLMFMPLCVAIYSLCLPISPNDFWYHARAGSVTATTGHIPTQNLFSTGVPLDTPYFNQGWIAHWAFYKILGSGGLDWIAVFRSACMAFAYALIAWAAFRRARRVAHAQLSGQESPAQLLEIENSAAHVAALAALLTFLMSALNMDVRPQTFSFPLFAFFTFAVYEWPFNDRARPILMLLLGVALALWSNLHGAFLTALIALWMVCVGEWIHAARHLTFFGAVLSTTARYQLLALAGLCSLTAMINPRGAGIYHYAFGLAGNYTSQKFIAEWQRPSFLEWNSDVFFIAPFLLAYLIYKSAPRADKWLCAPCGVRAGEILALLALVAMGFRNVRAIVWFALFFAPAFSGAFMAAFVSAKLKAQKAIPEPTPAVYAMNAVMAFLLLFLIVPALPWIKPELPLPPAYQARFAPTPQGKFPLGFADDPPLLIENTTPVEAIDFLRKHPPRGKLYNEMVFGSYLMWALYPKTLPNADPRIELYPDEYWKKYLEFNNNPRNAGAVLTREGYSDALLNPKLQEPLVEELSRTPGWKKYAFKSGPAILFRRVAP